MRSVVTLVLHCYSAATSRCYIIGYSVLCLLSHLLSHLWPVRPFDLRAINRNLSNVTTLPIMHANSPCLHLNLITAKLFHHSSPRLLLPPAARYRSIRFLLLLFFFLLNSWNCCSDQFGFYKAMNHQIMAEYRRGLHACCLAWV